MTTQTLELQAVTDEELQAAAGGLPLPFLFIVGLIAMDLEPKNGDHGQQGQVAECIDGVPSKACRRQAGAKNLFFS